MVFIYKSLSKRRTPESGGLLLMTRKRRCALRALTHWEVPSKQRHFPIAPFVRCSRDESKGWGDFYLREPLPHLVLSPPPVRSSGF